MRRAALDYARAGYPVLPLHTMREGVCSCGDAGCRSPGKHPRTRRGFLNASTDPGQVARWWTFWPDANIGCVPGPSGHVVLDIDGPEGEAALAALDLPATREVVTGRGRHLWFRYRGPAVANGRPFGPGIDVRGHGGYVILPPSVHPSGRVYAWCGADEAAELPAAIVARLPMGGHGWVEPVGPTEAQATALVRLMHDPVWSDADRRAAYARAEATPTRAYLQTMIGELNLEAQRRRKARAALETCRNLPPVFTDEILAVNAALEVFA